MDNILLLFLCLFIGFGLQYLPSFPKNGYQALNHFVIYISLPALALYYIPKIEVSSNLLYPLGIAWVGFALSYVFFSIIGKRLGWSRKLTGCLILTGGLGNTAFVGFPVIEALYGNSGLKTAIIVDQPGSFVVMATLGIIVATLYSRGTPDVKVIASKIFLFPPFIAFLLAACMNSMQLDFLGDIQSVLLKLGSTVSPIALVSVGLQLKIDRHSKHWRFLSLGLFFKLFITPLFFLVLYKYIFKGSGLLVDVSILESAMAPMITGSILASNYGLKPKLSSMMVGVGIPLSFVTLAFWYWVLTVLQ